jgi:phosphohistidine phosphatase
MKRLILLRHAKSSWDDQGLSDHDRPLSRRGLSDAPRMGEHLAMAGIAPDLLLTSSALRARTTAELVSRSLQPPGPATRIDPAIYLASPGKLLEVLAGVDDEIDELMLVGHNPGLTQLANMLLPELKLFNLPTAGAVAIDCEASGWSALDAGSFRLVLYDFPKNTERPQARST